MGMQPIVGILGRTGVLGKNVSRGLSPLLSRLADPTVRLTRENIQDIWKTEFKTFGGGRGMSTDAAASITRYAKDMRANRILFADEDRVAEAHLSKLPQSITKQRTRYRYKVQYEYKGIEGQDVKGFISVGDNKLLSASEVEDQFQTMFQLNQFATDIPVPGVGVDKPKVKIEDYTINAAIRRQR